MSKLSKFHVKTTPDTCIQCRLCEDACPMGAIQKPGNGTSDRKRSLKKTAILISMLPVVVVLSGWAVSQLNLIMARVHDHVYLAEQISIEDQGYADSTSLETRTFRMTGTPTRELIEEAKSIQEKFRIGGWFLGGFLGLVFGLKVINISVLNARKDYETDKANCFSCARCFESCPNEHVRLDELNREVISNVKRIQN